MENENYLNISLLELFNILKTKIILMSMILSVIIALGLLFIYYMDKLTKVEIVATINVKNNYADILSKLSEISENENTILEIPEELKIDSVVKEIKQNLTNKNKITEYGITNNVKLNNINQLDHELEIIKKTISINDISQNIIQISISTVLDNETTHELLKSYIKYINDTTIKEKYILMNKIINDESTRLKKSRNDTLRENNNNLTNWIIELEYQLNIAKNIGLEKPDAELLQANKDNKSYLGTKALEAMIVEEKKRLDEKILINKAISNMDEATKIINEKKREISGIYDKGNNMNFLVFKDTKYVDIYKNKIIVVTVISIFGGIVLSLFIALLAIVYEQEKVT